MRLSEFPPNTKVRRISWRKGLYAILTLSGRWAYIEDGKHAGNLSSNMLDYADFEHYSPNRVVKHTQYNEDGTTTVTMKKEKEIIMDNVNFVGGEYNVVKVKLTSNSQSHYNFKIAADLPIEEGNLVVVHSVKGLALARVIRGYANNFENAGEISKATAWVVNVVDETIHLNRVKATEKREYILKQLEERKEAMEATQVYEMLGSIDPVAKKLLKQLKKLS